MTDTRRLQKDVRALVGKDAPPKTLAPRDAATPLPAAVGSAKPRLAGSGASTQTGTAGIASPLTEPDYGTRTWHTGVTITSTDGIWAQVFEDVATLDLLDANDQPVQIILDSP